MESRTQGSRPRTQTKSKAKDSPSEADPLEAKDRNARGLGKDTSASALQKIKVFKNFFSGDFKKKKQKGLHKNSSGDLQKKGLHKNFSGDLQKKKQKDLHKNFSGDLQKNTSSKIFFRHSKNFNNSKNSAVLEPRTGQFSRT